MKVLTVDNSRLIRTILSDIIKEEGHVVLEAATATEAVEIYQKERPDVTFMDIILGERNGIEAMKDIKEINKDAVVIICTSIIGQEDVVQKSHEFGAEEYITKPFKQNEIKNILQKYQNLLNN